MDESVDAIALRIDTQWFAFEANAVRAIVSPPPITRVPEMAEYVVGVALVRGELVGVIDLRRLIEGDATRTVAGNRARLVIIATGDTALSVLADETRGVVPLELANGAAVGLQRAARWNATSIALLDADRVAEALREAETP